MGKKLQAVQPISPVHCTHPFHHCHDDGDDDEYDDDDDDDDIAFGRPPRQIEQQLLNQGRGRMMDCSDHNTSRPAPLFLL